MEENNSVAIYGNANQFMDLFQWVNYHQKCLVSNFLSFKYDDSIKERLIMRVGKTKFESIKQEMFKSVSGEITLKIN